MSYGAKSNLLAFLFLSLLISPITSLGVEFCYKATGKRRVPNLRNVQINESISHPSETFLQADFSISPGLEVLKGHFPEQKILPGVVFAQMGTKLIDKYAESLKQTYNYTQVVKFNHSYPGYPKSKVRLTAQAEPLLKGKVLWHVKAFDPMNEKNVYANGVIKSMVGELPKHAIDSAPIQTSPILYSALENFNFIRHGKEIFFPFETLEVKLQNSYPKEEIPALSELDMKNNFFRAKVRIPNEHLLLQKNKAGNWFLPATNFTELGAQAATLSMKPLPMITKMLN